MMTDIARHKLYFLAAMAAWAALSPLKTFGEDVPIENGTRVVPLEKPEQALDTPAPLSQFIIPNGEEIWNRALLRAATLPPDHSGGFFDASQLVGEGFRSAKKFKSEKYIDGDSGTELLFAISADEAIKEESRVILTQMRLVYFINKNPLMLAGSKKKDAAATGAAEAKKEPAKKKEKAPDAQMPMEGRIVITAPRAIIDVATNEGRATGSVKVEIYSRIAGSKSDAPVAVLSSEWLRWRTWSEPWSGSTEMAMYACGEKPGDPDPMVSAHYQMQQADGAPTSVIMEGSGMIYETGSYDRATPKEDEDGRTVGLSLTARNRAIFHSRIKMKTTAAAMSAFGMAFTGTEAATAPGAPAKAPAKEAAPAAPTETIVSCNGPAILDLAVVPRKEATRFAAPKTGKARSFPVEVKTDSESEIVENTILLARRFEFLNGVKMIRYPLPAGGAAADSAPAPEDVTEMSCRHLRMQWAAGEMPRPSAPPEYAEAVGGVQMRGTDIETPVPGQAAPPSKAAFMVNCQRLYFDGVNDNMFLVGSAKQPVEVKHEKKGDASAQQFCYRRKTQTLTMPMTGAKRLVIRGGAMTSPGAAPSPAGNAAKPDSVFDLGAGDTIVEWSGPLSREIVHLPVPLQPDRIKEILTLNEDVLIEQAGGGLKMRGQKIRLVRNMPGGEVEFLESLGGVDVKMGELKARGEAVTVDMAYGADGQLTKNLITVVGDTVSETPATLFMSGSAVRAIKFIVDRQANTFRALGGAVAVVKAADQANAPADPRPQAAQDAGGLFKGISFSSGGNLFMQCDGDFTQDGATNQVIIKKNVLIKQPGLQLLADEVYLTLDDTPPADGKNSKSGAATPGDSFFSGKLKSVDCRGGVELTTPDQFVQSDRLVYEVPKDTSVLEMDDPENDVRVYLREESGNTKVLSAKKSLQLDGKSGLFRPGGVMYMLPYRGATPAPRGKENSPARRKK